MFDKIIFKGVCVCKTCGFQVYIQTLKRCCYEKHFRSVLLVPHYSFYSSAQKSDKVNLPNGWSLSTAGHGYLSDLPLNMAISPSKKLIAVTNNGQSIQII